MSLKIRNMEYKCREYYDCNFVLSKVLNFLKKDIELLFSQYKSRENPVIMKEYLTKMSIYIQFLNTLKEEYKYLQFQRTKQTAGMWPLKKTREEQEKDARILLKQIKQEHTNLTPIYNSIIVIIDKMNTILNAQNKDYRELIMCMITVMLGIKTMVKVIRKKRKIEEDTPMYSDVQEKLEKFSMSGKTDEKEDDRLMNELEKNFHGLDIRRASPRQSSSNARQSSRRRLPSQTQ